MNRIELPCPVKINENVDRLVIYNIIYTHQNQSELN